MSPTLRLADVLCPICRDIYIEPIVLPCSHTICLSCLEKAYEINSSACPVCRKRIATFLRQARSLKKLVDLKLWSAIRKEFSQEISRKQNGEEIRIEQESVPTILAQSGSIKLEFDEMINKFKCEEEKARFAEEAASKKLAKQLMEQEEREAEARKKKQEQIVKSDKLFVQNLIFSEQEKLSETSKPGLEQNSTTMTGELCGRDSISDEFRHFTPICIAPITPPKCLPNGKVGIQKIHKPVNLNTQASPRKVLTASSSIKNKTCLKVCSNNFARTHVLPHVSGMVSKSKECRSLVAGRHQMENIRPESSNIISNDVLYNQEGAHAKIKQEQDDLALALKLHAKWNNTRVPTKRNHSHYTLRSSKKFRVDR